MSVMKGKIAFVTFLFWLPSVSAHASESPDRPSEAALSALTSWRVLREPVDYLRFVRERRGAAERLGHLTDTDPSLFERAWREAPIESQTVVLAAVAQLGKDYVYASSDPSVGFDCSGLTRHVWDQVNVKIPKTSRDQLRLPQVTSALPGDILARDGHVAVWTGVDDIIVHAANQKTGVVASRTDIDRYVLVRPTSPSLQKTRPLPKTRRTPSPV